MTSYYNTDIASIATTVWYKYRNKN